MPELHPWDVHRPDSLNNWPFPQAGEPVDPRMHPTAEIYWCALGQQQLVGRMMHDQMVLAQGVPMPQGIPARGIAVTSSSGFPFMTSMPAETSWADELPSQPRRGRASDSYFVGFAILLMLGLLALSIFAGLFIFVWRTLPA